MSAEFIDSEAVFQLILSNRLGMISERDLESLLARAEEISKMHRGLNRSLHSRR